MRKANYEQVVNQSDDYNLSEMYARRRLMSQNEKGYPVVSSMTKHTQGTDRPKFSKSSNRHMTLLRASGVQDSEVDTLTETISKHHRPGTKQQTKPITHYQPDLAIIRSGLATQGAPRRPKLGQAARPHLKEMMTTTTRNGGVVLKY